MLQTLHVPTANGNILRAPVAWSPDGQFLACATGSLGMLVFDLASGGLLRTPTPFPVDLTGGAVWSPDGSMLISGDEYGVAYVWDAASGEIIRRLEGNASRVQRLEWSPEGDLLAVLCLSAGAENEGMDMIVWDMRRTERVHIVPSQLSDGFSAWGSSARYMVGTNSGSLFCWDIESGEQVWQTPTTGPSRQWLARSPDGTKIASSRDDGTVRIWDLHTGAFLQMLSRDRPYERLNITGIKGLTEAQKSTLRDLGAIDDVM
jgi:WD40 repeat protein